jgi:hypothetical protein
MAYKIDLTTRNASIAIVLGLDVLFFAVAIGASVQPAFAELSTKLWGLFAGTNGALMLALNASGSNTPTPPPPAVAGA